MKHSWKTTISKLQDGSFGVFLRTIISATSIIFYCDIDKNYSFISILLFLLFFLLYKYPFKKSTKKSPDNLFLLIFSIFFSILLVVGKTIYNTNDVTKLFDSFSSILINLITAIGVSIIVYYSLIYITPYLKKVDSKNGKNEKESRLWKFYNNKHIFLILYLIIFISFIPAWLTHFPGIFSYDVTTQTEQALGGLSSIYALQPPIHTTIWMLCIKVANHTGFNALILYEIPQLLFMAYAFTRFVKFLIDRKVNKYIILGSILWFTINPVVSIFVLLCTKDVYFSGLLLLIMVEFIEFLSKDSAYKKSSIRWVYFSLLILFACLFRNNMIYVFILLLFLLLLLQKTNWKNILKIFLVPIILYYIIVGPIYKMVGIGKGNVREMLSVPIQQIGLVVTNHYDELSEDELQAIDAYIPLSYIQKQYNLRLSDPVKDHFKSDHFSEDKLSFFKIYLHLLMKYPGDYISSFLTLNISYWYIDAATHDPISNYGYIENGMVRLEQYPIERTSFLPFLQPYYNSVSNYSLFEKIPFINILFSVSLPVWVLLFSLIVMLYKRLYIESLVFMPMILLWLTYLLGPVSIFRYIFPFFLCYPFFVATLINSKKLFKK